uniref:Uncharacterized protein n=1 Tax=Anopheles merus TaxID=30066 RepID=A0A182VJP1_ANOME
MASKRTWESANQQPRASTAPANRALRAVQTFQIIEDDPAPGTSIAGASECRSLLVVAVKKLQHQSTQTVEPSEVRIKRERIDEPSVPSSPQQQQPDSKPVTTAPSPQQQQPGSQPAPAAQTMRPSSEANRTFWPPQPTLHPVLPAQLLIRGYVPMPVAHSSKPNQLPTRTRPLEPPETPVTIRTLHF